MTSRGKARARGQRQPSYQTQPSYQSEIPPQTSDYDMSAPTTAPAPQAQPQAGLNMRLNLSVLSRYFPDVDTMQPIIFTTVMTTLYNCTPEGQWVEADIRGPLFIVRLVPSPEADDRFAVVIMNRHGMENFFFEIESEKSVVDNGELTELCIPDTASYGLFVFQSEDPEHTTYQAAKKAKDCMMECASVAAESRQRCASEQLAHAGRKPSNVAELFELQREEDAGFGLHDHHSHPSSNTQSPFGNARVNASPYPEHRSQSQGHVFGQPEGHGLNHSPGNLLNQLFAKDRQERHIGAG